MKRFFYIMFTCACALLGFVPTAKAQTNGDIVTIKSGDYYLAVNEDGTAIDDNDKTTPDQYCYWLITVDNNTYTFRSVIGNRRYLNVGNTLSLGINSQNITRNGNYYYRRTGGGPGGNKTYYIRYSNSSGWSTTENTDNRSSLTLTPVTRNFTSVSPSDDSEVSELTTITVTTDEGAAINSVTEGSITISGGATISNVTSDANTLTISVAGASDDGTYTLDIPAGAVKDAYGIPFNAVSYSWDVVAKGHKYTNVDPAVGETSAFNTIRLTTDADIMSTLHFGKDFEFVNDNKVSFTFTSENGATETSIMGQGVGAKRIDDRTLEITIPSNLGAGTYTLSLAAGAILGKDNEPFAAKTYTWEVEPHTFASISPNTVPQGEHLSAITLTAPEGVKMSINNPNGIVLKNAGNATVPTTATINADNELVITPAAPLGNGSYTLNIAKGAVVGPHLVAFNAYEKKWDVVVSVSITHVNGFYNALGAGGYQQVHTVERTIYYNNDKTSIPLTLAETNFFGYMRWYNYATDGGEDITWVNNDAPRSNNGNFVEVTDNTKHLGWFGWNRSNTTGNPVANGGTGGVLNNAENSNQTPNINISGWTGTRTIACDVSHYLDYTVTRVNDKIVGVKEPRLSYRQLFHFKPASVMADRFAALKDGKYLEEYTYTAPTGTNVYLSTEFRYNGDDAENCYFYYDGTSIKRVTSATWSTGVTWSAPYGVVSSDAEGTKTYTLTSGTLRIAKFTVKYVDGAKYGPVQETGTNGSAKALMSYAEMKANFEVLEYNNFSFGKTPNSSAQQYLTTPLPYDQSTYGFSHMANDAIKPNDDYDVPYYGEYSIVNRIGSTYWETSANHVDGGATVDQAAAQGFGIYVDGTTKPGVVASIATTKVNICAHRKMYCSVWLRNPRPSGQCGNGVYKPIFRCNVQGRNQLSDGTHTPWEDVGVYFVGELPCASDWNQVNFPIESQDTYTECRVQIYNFGTGGNGNDFWLDDLCIYAERLPMSSYQLQTETCCSPNHNGTTFTAAVLRVDYGSTTLADDSYQYYQIYNETEEKPLKLTAASLSPYYHEKAGVGDVTAHGKTITPEEYGSILIRPHTFDPESDENTEIVKNNPSELIADLLEDYAEDNTNPLWGKCFVRKTTTSSTSEGDWYLYVVHLVPNIKTNRVHENYIKEQCEYTLRMTNDPSGLIEDPNKEMSCAVEIDLPSTQQSLFRLVSDQIETTEFLCNSTNNCANDLYTLEAFIRKDSDPYSDQGEAEGTYLADWMYGHAFDEVYRMDYPHADDDAEHAAQSEADNKFEAAYHCTRAQVTDAFLDLRRPDVGNANYTVTTFAEIDPTEFSDYDTDQTKDYPSKSLHYETLQYLHKQGWLQLATSSVSFYLGSESKARYWVFPIENSAKDAKGNPLHDCPEPRWVEVSSKETPYYVNIAPGVDISSEEAKEAADPRTGTRIPNVRVLARLVNNTIQIPIHQASIGDYAVNFTGDNGYVFLTDDDAITNPKALKYSTTRSGDVITLIPSAGNTAELKLGKQYTMCVRMFNKDNKEKVDGDACDVGKIYMKLLILPDVVVWTPPTTDNDNWHDDANWSGYGEDNAYHYAPIAGSGVVIQNNGVHSPVLTEIAPANHPHPMDANFALTPTCGQIYFHPGAMMLNQHLLQHDKVFVDLVVPNQTWNTITVPISGVVSGDMYIPHEGDATNGTPLESSEPFDVQPFKGSRVRDSAFPFWMSFYNRTVERVNDNPTLTKPVIKTGSLSFAPTNSLNAPMEVGSGYQLLGWGPESMSAKEKLTIRLPKPENNYNYYYSSGYLAEVTTVTRGENPSKFVYSPVKPIQLTNEVQSQDFMFGNPTMAMIDLKAFLPAGAVIYKMVNDSWESATIETFNEENRYLRPMESVVLRMPSAAEKVNVELKTEHLITPSQLQDDNSGNNSPTEGGTTISPAGVAPRRPVEKMTAQMMTIYADVYGTKARCILAAKDEAEDLYSLGEDALFISSGVEADVNDAAATTPVNMYTLAKGVPMMVDVRENIDTVPMALLIHDYYRTDKVTFTFYLTDNWNKESYFCDAVTGTRTLITDSLVLEVAMPQNHEVRYYIDGPDVMNPDGGGDIWSSTEDVKTSTNQVWAYSPSQGQLVVASNDIIKAVTVYDIAGRLIGYRELEMQYNSTTFDTPTGACIVKAVLRDNTEHYISALVK